jgi:hypothetical protein
MSRFEDAISPFALPLRDCEAPPKARLCGASEFSPLDAARPPIEQTDWGRFRFVRSVATAEFG